MNKILFLDFDGVISTTRAWVAQKHVDDFYLRWIDPIAVGMLVEFLQEHPMKIVVTSTWRKSGYDNCVLALGPLAKYLHHDWRTSEIWPKGPNASAGSRPAEIDDWLKRNTNFTTEYLILDDDSFNWTEDQAARWIKTDTTNGFSTENYEAMLNAN